MAKTSKKKNKNKKKKQNKLRQQRHSLYSKISRRKKKLKKLKRARDIASHKKVSNQIMHIRREVSAINQKLGATVAPKKVIPSASSSASAASSTASPASKDVWITDPPYTKWQAMENFDKNIWSKKWKWFIIDGKKLPSSDPLTIEFEASNLWSKTGSKDVFLISYNPKKKTIKYEVY